VAEDLNAKPGCLGAVLRLFGIDLGASHATAEPLPYRLRDDFLSPAERSFYAALVSACDDRVTICPKVNLADIFFVSRPNENQGARGRISQKHLDFLLCESVSMRPVLGIELDDSSHSRPDRHARDELVDAVFEAAGLPLAHVPVRSSYSVPELSLFVGGYMGPRGEPSTVSVAPVVPVPASAGVPLCPKCGIPMLLRTSSRGDAKGSQFYGCANYPKCRQTMPQG